MCQVAGVMVSQCRRCQPSTDTALRMRCPRSVAPFVTALMSQELSQEHVE